MGLETHHSCDSEHDETAYQEQEEPEDDIVSKVNRVSAKKGINHIKDASNMIRQRGLILDSSASKMLDESMNTGYKE